MCGIVGWVSWGKPPNLELLDRMSSRLTHRGPDAVGLYTRGPVALGHRRLSILDLHTTSNQPMVSRCNRYVITFNGEIYNFISLKKVLEGHGSSFRTSGDTEVVLESFRVWGIDCLERLEGMFAFALWDSQTEKLFLCRDRIGEKPLFYTEILRHGLVFASELQALRVNPLVSREVDLDSFGQYLTMNYVSGRNSMIKGISKLLPGCYLVYSRNSKAKLVSYWDLASSFNEPKSKLRIEAAAEQLGSLIDDSVRSRLISDVPVGAFLSGGIDSSSIVASMSRTIAPDLVNTFCVGFDEIGYSEAVEAEKVANFLGVFHNSLTVGKHISSDIEKIINLMDEPVADTSFIPCYYLAQFARQSVKVALSGDGGDELLGGYETYSADKLKSCLGWVPKVGWGVTKWLIETFLPISHDKVSFDYKLRQFIRGQNLDADQAHLFWRTIFDSDEKREILNEDIYRDVMHLNPFEFQFAKLAEVPRANYLDRAMYLDIKTWLPDDILAKTDRASMAHSLEVRSPFLDRRIVEFCATLPIEFKVSGMTKKFLLKKSQKSRLPYSVLHQRKKGFNAPLAKWLNSDLKDVLFQATTNDRVGNYFKLSAVKKLWAEHERFDRDNSYKLFGIACFSMWLDSRNNRGFS